MTGDSPAGNDPAVAVEGEFLGSRVAYRRLVIDLAMNLALS